MADKPNQKSDFKVIGSALGADDKTLDTVAQLYRVAAKQLGKYVKLGGSLITGGNAVIEIASGLLQAFGTSKGPSEFDILYLKIEALVKQLEQKIDAVSRQIGLLALAELKGMADSSITVAMNFAERAVTQGTGSANDFRGAFDNALSDSVKAFVMIQNSVYWTRTYDPTLIADVPGSKRERYAPPREADDAQMVWDYRAALPVLLKVVEARLLCMQLASAPITQTDAKALDAIADFLTRTHNRIQSGFVLTEVPGARSPGSIKGPDWQYSVLASGFWDVLGRPCGAVDRYGGYALVEEFPLMQPKPLKTPKPPLTSGAIAGQNLETPDKSVAAQQGIDRRNFNLLYLTRALRARDKLDERVGLPGLRDVVAQLRAMTGNKWGVEAPPKKCNFGLSEVADPPQHLRDQLQREIFGVKTASGPPMLPFEVAWPQSVAALTNEFTERYRLGAPPSVAAIMQGDG